MESYESGYISSLTVTELLIGVERAADTKIRIKRSAFVEHIMSFITNIPFGESEARMYAQILNDLYRRNITLGSHDMIIASTAIANGYAVLTLNGKDFKRIEGLEVIEL